MESKSKGLIFKIERMATDDGPGIRTTIFFNRCLLNCNMLVCLCQFLKR